MKTQSILLFFVFSASSLFAQFSDDFSGSTVNTSIWFGDLENFTISDNMELQLLDTATLLPKSQIVAEVKTADSTNWEFYYRQDFSASSSNFSRIYLASNNSDLSGSLNGYFVQLGGISGNADRIELYRQTGTDTELLISGKDSTLAAEPSEGRISVSRTGTGRWTLSADYTGGSAFVVEGSAIDSTHRFGTYFGIECKYTSSRFDKFFFDDISVDPLFVDIVPPRVIQLEVLDELTVNLLFDEPLDQSSAENNNNYQIGATLLVSDAVLDPANAAAVQLTFNSPLISEQVYELQILGVQDQDGNAQNNQILPFTFYKTETALAYDLLINEIYADQSPPIGLPETEYLELYNKSEKIIDLQDFILADNNAEIVLPSQLIFPDQHLILYKSGTGDFAAFGDTLPIPDLFTLGNSFDDLVLYNPDGEVIHSVFYQKNWYGNSDKAEGGFSLELINPRAPCTFRDNWIASESPIGGTPGQANSVLSENSDSEVLDLFRAFPLFGAAQIELMFNKSLDITEAENIDNYELDGIAITQAEVVPPLFNQVILTLASPLVTRTNYTLNIKTTLKDCIGGSANGEINVELGVPEAYDAQDIIINEVLFNPEVGGVDFVELYNRSDKIIDISNLFIANRDTNNQIDKVVSVGSNFLLLPDRYAVLTTNPVDIENRYTVENPKALVTLLSLPSYANKFGSVVLYFIEGAQTVFVDEFSYEESYHNPLLDDKNGVSLERISPDNPTQDPDNWHTAAQSVGFATPTYRNSQFSVESPENSDLIALPYTTFSPDSDGFRDFLSIQYQTPGSGYLANVRIFDTKGRPVRTISQNELLGTEGILQWDGTNSEGRKARIGIYLLWIELFHPDGTVEQFKENCVLAGQLN